MLLRGEVALVTGAAAGLGAAIARRFAAEGARVALADRNADGAEEVARGIRAAGGEAMSCFLDVTDDAGAGEAVARVTAEWGAIGILVNNAGIAQRPAGFVAAEAEMIDRIFAVNVRGLFHVTRHVLPGMMERKRGAIVNLASNAGLRPRPGMAWYNASKAAVVNLTQTMAAELAPHCIRVNAIAPSLADTPMKSFIMEGFDEAAEALVLQTIPLGRLATGEDIAAAAAFLASGESRFVTGVILPVDGGRMVA
jgi:3-oxoacyl-[acyl-carrier protein] reductase